MKRLILYVIPGLFAYSVLAKTDCDLDLSIQNVTLQVLEYSQLQPQTATITRGSDSPQSNGNGQDDALLCSNYRLFFSKGLANSYQRKAFTAWGSSINYNLHANANQSGILKDVSDALNTAESLPGTAPSINSTYGSSYFVSVPGVLDGSIVSGTFTDQVQVSLYSVKKNGQLSYEDSELLTLLFIVPAVIQLSLVEEGAEFDASSTSKVLNFGLLSKDQIQGADLRVVSNSAYKISVSSTNQGSMKGASGSQVNYSLSVNGSPVSLQSLGGMIGSGAATSASGDRYNLKFKILDETGTLPAGLYQDQLTFTATAN